MCRPLDHFEVPHKLGGDELGTGRHTSGFVFGRALAIVERATANEGSWPDSVAPLALQVASLGTEVEERPNCTGQPPKL